MKKTWTESIRNDALIYTDSETKHNLIEQSHSYANERNKMRRGNRGAVKTEKKRLRFSYAHMIIMPGT